MYIKTLVFYILYIHKTINVLFMNYNIEIFPPVVYENYPTTKFKYYIFKIIKNKTLFFKFT